MRKILVTVIALVIAICSTAPCFAITPPYKPLSEYGYNGVPEIKIELPDDMKAGVDAAVQEQLEKDAVEDEAAEEPVDSEIEKPLYSKLFSFMRFNNIFRY